MSVPYERNRRVVPWPCSVVRLAYCRTDAKGKFAAWLELHAPAMERSRTCNGGQPPMSFASSPELRAEVLTACRVLTHFRIVEGFGHVSAHIADAERILITPRKALGLV